MSTDTQTSVATSVGSRARWPGISVIVPVYRSELILPELVRRLGEVLPGVAEQYELILVNDSSPDASWEVMLRLAEEQPWIHAINLMRNYGQHNALLCGIRSARYGVIGPWTMTCSIRRRRLRS